jgi:hypothetical protein
MKLFNTQWGIVLTATLFNVLFEYSLRGINNIAANPGLPIILFLIYLTLFLVVEDMIVQFKLKDYQLIILAFFYGTIYDAFTSGILFFNPQAFGIAWNHWFNVNFFWWGFIQALLTFYIANRVSKRNWNHPKLSRKALNTAIMINIGMVLLFQLSGAIPKGQPIAYLTILIILFVAKIVFFGTIKHNAVPIPFQPSKFLDVLSILTVLVFLFTAIFLTHDPVISYTSAVNATSLKVIGLWTLIVTASLIGYRIKTKKSIPV